MKYSCCRRGVTGKRIDEGMRRIWGWETKVKGNERLKVDKGSLGLLICQKHKSNLVFKTKLLFVFLCSLMKAF